ncbi:isoaspartyl peptidase/L-asparaginase [Akkermansiaceae bacterium]|nr:isoaspartyl peptidase/L-asparaginase [bacterium]MDC0321145.1 isoaspartyl peptidase/L-asparaginase [Akkermansiaceae bacterium]MDC0568778.1 isoaspartyl peptidase/L-asparaginase [Akkermansiaceae bacterium]
MNTILSTLTVIIRRGSGRYESASITDEAYDVALRKIAEQAFAILSERGARETALRGLMMLDGKARMSEAFMDGSTGRLGAVINVENIPHPVELAYQISQLGASPFQEVSPESSKEEDLWQRSSRSEDRESSPAPSPRLVVLSSLDQPPFSPIRSGPKAASKPSRQKQIPSSNPIRCHKRRLL